MNVTSMINTIFTNETGVITEVVHMIHQGFKTTYTIVLVHLLIIGLLGNLTVVYVVLRFSTMQTVTNIHLLSLAVADILYLLSMPFFLTIINMEIFIFGNIGCKIYMILNGVNWFAGTYSLTIMSVDRYLAVVHPIKSQSFRVPKIAVFLVVGMWIVCVIVMLPVFMYSKINSDSNYTVSHCNIVWPGTHGSYAFILYSFFLGYLLPVVAISFFYSMVIHRLRTVGPKNKSKERRDSHRRITRLVLAIIIVYVVLWFPYWTQQILLVTLPEGVSILLGNIYLALTCQLFGFLNCVINPFLYAFMSQNFRAMFQQLLQCGRGSHHPHQKRGNLGENSCGDRITATSKLNKNLELTANIMPERTNCPILTETECTASGPTLVLIERPRENGNGLQETHFLE